MFLQVNRNKLKFFLYIFFFLKAIVDEDSLSDVYDRICEVIDREQSLDHIWIPSKEKL